MHKTIKTQPKKGTGFSLRINVDYITKVDPKPIKMVEHDMHRSCIKNLIPIFSPHSKNNLVGWKLYYFLNQLLSIIGIMALMSHIGDAFTLLESSHERNYTFFNRFLNSYESTFQYPKFPFPTMDPITILII